MIEDILQQETLGDSYLVTQHTERNEQHQWPIRLLLCKSKPELVSLIERNLKDKNCPDETSSQRKYSSTVTQLMELHQHNNITACDTQPSIELSIRQLNFTQEVVPHSLNLLTEMCDIVHNLGVINEIHLLGAPANFSASTNPLANYQHPLIFQFDVGIDAVLIEQRLSARYDVSYSSVTADMLVIDGVGCDQYKIENAVIKLSQQLVGQSSKLPKLLGALYQNEWATLSITLAPLAVQEQREVRYVVKHARLLGKPRRTFYSNINEQHAIVVFDVELIPIDVILAIEFIVNCSVSLLNRRLAGHCYTIESRLCFSQRQLIFFSAFDVAPLQAVSHIIDALDSLASDADFIAQALPPVIDKIAALALCGETVSGVDVPVVDASNLTVEQIQTVIRQLRRCANNDHALLK